MPDFLAQFTSYEKIGLRDLCEQIHGIYKAHDVARVTTEMYLSDMVPAMKPSDAWARMAHGEIDRIDIDELEGRVTSVLLTPYPPGIPLLIPGERFNATIMGYLQFARKFNSQFPGFETASRSLVEKPNGELKVLSSICVRASKNGDFFLTRRKHRTSIAHARVAAIAEQHDLPDPDRAP